jgi:RNA-directed DNA polymerase
MLREKFKGKPPEDKSTDARHRGGVARSSEEGSVMELERRGCIVRLSRKVNRKWEESFG